MKVVINLILLILIKLLLEYAYVEYVVKYYEYDGFHYIFSLDKYIFGWIIYLGGYFVLRMKSYIYIYEIFLFLFLLYLLPNIIYYSLSNQSTNFFIAIVLSYFITLLFISNKSIIGIKKISKGKPIILFLSFISTLIVVIHLVISTGGHMVLNFRDVYDFREQFEKINSSGFFGYLNSWVSKIFVVLFFSWSIQRNKKILIGISFFLIVLLFVFSGHKAVLQSIILIIFFYYLYKIYDLRKKELFIIFSFFFLIALILVITNYYDATILASLIIRRLLFIPSQLNFVYFDFFSHHNFAYWGNSILKYFINYPYSVDISHVIGTYLGHPEENANTGYIASGYAQAGYFGIILYTFLSIVVLNLINSFFKQIEKYIAMSIVFIPVQVFFTSSDFLTTLLTHGLLIAILVLWLYENKNYVLRFGQLKYII